MTLRKVSCWPAKRRVRQVLGGGRGAHGHGDVAAAVLGAQLRVGGADVRVELRLQRRVDHPAADLAAGGGQRRHVLDVERGELVEDALVQVVVGDEVLEGLGRRRVAARHGDTEACQVADHLAERGVLAADPGQIGQAQRVQPEDVLVQAGDLQGGGRVRARYDPDMIAAASDAYKLDSTGFFVL